MDVDSYRDGESCDVLILGQTQEYTRWLTTLRRLREAGVTVILDATNDVFSSDTSFATVSRYTGLRAAAWQLQRSRLRVQTILKLGNWGHARDFWREFHAVVAGSAIQAHKYRPYIARTFDLVDPVNPAEFQARARSTDRRPIVMAWEGSRDNLPYLLPYATAFRELDRDRVAVLRIVTDRFRSVAYHGTTDNELLLRKWSLQAEFVEWQIDTFSHALASADVGIAPLPLTDEFSRAKPANKILGYAFLGLPVVASAIPSYLDVLGQARFGLAASTSAEWAQAVRTLADSPRQRNSMGELGREYVLAEHTPSRFAMRYLDFIKQTRAGSFPVRASTG